MSNKSLNLISSSPTIAIIGGGCSGSLVAVNILRNATIPVSIFLIERNQQISRGIAYGTKNQGHLLNVPVGKMSAFADEPDHFLNWLGENGYKSVESSSFVPRQIYGDYLEAILKEAQSNAMVYVQLERITDEAIAIETTLNQTSISFLSGRVLVVQKVVLALGNFPASLPAPLASIENREQYVRCAWSVEAVTDLKNDAAVLLVGTGLTMVDAVISLKQFKGKIYAVSRHGLLPLSHKPTNPYPTFIDVETAPKTARELLVRVRQEVNSATVLGQDWRAVLNALRPITNSLWQALPLEEQRRFLRHLKAYWEVNRHRIAQEIVEILSGMNKTGQLSYYAGRIETSQVINNIVNVGIRERKTGQLIKLQVNRIINCTGSNTDYCKLKNRLIENLLKQGLISPHTLSIGIKTAGNGATVDHKGNISQTIYTLGTPRKGDLWETTAVPEIRVQAVNLARELLQSFEIKSQSFVNPWLPKKTGQTNPSKNSHIIFRQLFDKESSTYTYLLADPETKAAILVDPVLEQVERDLQVLRELELTLHYCLETHLHADHITGANRLRELTGCLNIVPENAQTEDVDDYITDKSFWQLGNVYLEAIATPGHTDSHMAYLVNDLYLLTGDALLIRGCGRTDFQNGSADLLFDTVTTKLFTLPDDTLVYPCHDYQGRTVSSIGEEKRWNPRFVGRSRDQFIELMLNLNLPLPKKMLTTLPANQRGGKVVFVLDYQI